MKIGKKIILALGGLGTIIDLLWFYLILNKVKDIEHHNRYIVLGRFIHQGKPVQALLRVKTTGFWLLCPGKVEIVEPSEYTGKKLPYPGTIQHLPLQFLGSDDEEERPRKLSGSEFEEMEKRAINTKTLRIGPSGHLFEPA